jgi:hypothetical protein
MTVYRRMDTKASREYWAGVDKIAAEVATWPAWLRGVPDSSKAAGTAPPVESSVPEPCLSERNRSTAADR